MCNPPEDLGPKHLCPPPLCMPPTTTIGLAPIRWMLWALQGPDRCLEGVLGKGLGPLESGTPGICYGLTITTPWDAEPSLVHIEHLLTSSPSHGSRLTSDSIPDRQLPTSTGTLWVAVSRLRPEGKFVTCSAGVLKHPFPWTLSHAVKNGIEPSIRFLLPAPFFLDCWSSLQVEVCNLGLPLGLLWLPELSRG